jgi:hypothetical protein
MVEDAVKMEEREGFRHRRDFGIVFACVGAFCQIHKDKTMDLAGELRGTTGCSYS